jgi:gamma-glutamyltranspeptidase / glutathione hydrolase
MKFYDGITKRMFSLLLILFISFLLISCRDKDEDPDDDPTNGEDPIDYHDLEIREAFGQYGMVASASSYASKVGIDILKAGGNAFDAAIAVAFTLGVTEANASGIGGGGFLIGYVAETGERIAYDYREFAPGAATRELYANSDLDVRDGPGSFGIPMFVDGMLTLWEDLATLPLSDLIDPSITLARDGFEVPPALAEAIASQFSKLMRSRTEALKVYSADGFSPIQEGDLLTNEDLANVLELIVDQGKDGFYKGDVALAIVNAIQDAGGIVTMADMHRAIGSTVKDAPLSSTYKDYEIVSMYPPSSGATTLAQFFNMLEVYETTYGPIQSLDHNSAPYLHLIGSALQLSYGDRRRFVGDTLFVDVPMLGLMSKAYAAERFTLFNPEVGRTFIGAEQYGDPWSFNQQPLSLNTKSLSDNVPYGEESGSTTHFTIIDQYGNTVSSTNTINYFFGNGIIPAGTGIILNNIMSPFSLNINNLTAGLEPYKRPLSNMSPTIVLKEGEPYMAIGSPGSMRITSAIVQVILNVIEFDMDIQSAIESPRIFHYVGDAMEIEGAMGQDVINALIALGYNPTVYNGTNLYFGGVHAITIDLTSGQLHGGADPRRDGKALGY